MRVQLPVQVVYVRIRGGDIASGGRGQWPHWPSRQLYITNGREMYRILIKSPVVSQVCCYSYVSILVWLLQPQLHDRRADQLGAWFLKFSNTLPVYAHGIWTCSSAMP